jgi:hypothetical protein
LELGLREAVVALRFKPVMEAELPEGFPAPGPVGEIIVKEYPPYRLARTPMGGGQTRSFGVLFKHIQSNGIPMTAPVEMTYARRDGGEEPTLAPAAMAFLYRAPTVGETGKQGAVEVADVPAMTVVSFGVRGPYTDARLRESADRLRRWIETQDGQYVPDGEPRYFGYNSPFVPPWFQYGEVQIPVRKAPR